MYIRDLEYYQQIILQKNFSKVANFFHVSQPTISTAIKRLEEELNTQLIIRDHSHNELILTLSGEQLYRHATQILNEWAVTKAEIDRLNNEQIVLGLPPIIQNYYFTNIAQTLRERGMLKSITTVEGGSNDLRMSLQRGEVDIALLGSAEPMAYKSLLTEEFDRHSYQIFVSKHHPLAQKRAIKFSELRHEPFILFTTSFVHTQAINKLASRNHFHPNVIFRSSDVNFIMNMVANDLGVTFLTGITNQHRDDVVAIDLLDADQPSFITSIAYRSGHVLTPVQQKLLGILYESLER